MILLPPFSELSRSLDSEDGDSKFLLNVSEFFISLIGVTFHKPVFFTFQFSPHFSSTKKPLSISVKYNTQTPPFFVFWRNRPTSPPHVGQGIPIQEVSRSHTTTHHSREDSSGRVISSSQRLLLDNTQHSQQTHIHDPVGFEPTISAGEWPQTYVLDRADTVTSKASLQDIISWKGDATILV
jgi:hypothetical protein